MTSNRRAGILQLIAVIMFIIIAFMINKMLASSYEPPSSGEKEVRMLRVETVDVAPQQYRISFSATGSVQARSDIAIVPEVSGRVIAVNSRFYAGGNFKANSTLFEIDPRDFRLQVERLEAEVARAQTALEVERAESRAALAEWRQRHGRKKKAPDLVARKPQMNEAQANLKSAKAQLADAKLDLERTRFRLPFSGSVVDSSIAVGQYVAAGQPYGTLFDKKSLEVRASLEDQQLEWLLAAKNSSIMLHATYLGEKRSYKGVLKRAASVLDAQTRFATVSIGFAQKDISLLPGTFVDIEVQGEALEGVMQIPTSALQTQGMLYVVDADGALQFLSPEVLFQDAKYVIIRSAEPSLTLVTSRLPGAVEGMRVRTDDEEEEAPQEQAEDAETSEDAEPDGEAQDTTAPVMPVKEEGSDA